METLEKDQFKVPPNRSKINEKMSIPSQSHSQSQSQSQTMPSSESCSIPAASSKRIINKIPLDFSKLKQAGLDRQLAVALSKRNPSATKKIASATTSSTSASASISTSPILPDTSAATIIQFQRKNQPEPVAAPAPAPTPVRNKKGANMVAVDDQSLQIKALIKHKILNKLSRSMEATATSTSALPEDNRASTSGGFTVPIPKADLTARTKVPLILNSVNQLPKNRARCGVTRTRPPEILTTTAVIQQEKLTSIAKPTVPQPKLPKEQATAQAPSLIVLENKVLSPDEKIDLSALRLPKMQAVSEIAIKPAAGREIKIANDSLKISQEKLYDEGSSSKNILPRSAVGAKKVIHSANKLQMSREKLIQLAKDIQNQAMQKVKQSSKEQMPGITPIRVEPAISRNSIISIPATINVQRAESSIVVAPIREKSKASVPVENLRNVPKTKSSAIASATKIVYPLENVTSKDPIEVTTSVLHKPQISVENLNINTSLIAPATVTPPVIDVSTPSTEASSGVLSAVDFIAQLTANESLDSTDFTELSPEELSMTEKFNSSQIASSQEEELPIGKILQIQDMDILHATLCVDKNRPNVLCISPNAIKLENSKEIKTNSVSREEKNDLPKFQEPDNSHNLLLSQVITTTDIDNSNTHVKRVSDAVEIAKKEDDKSGLPRLPFKPKKGKINLVQRNKKAKVVKPNEKIPEEPVNPVEIADLETNKSDNSIDKNCEQPLKISENETQEPKKVSVQIEEPLNVETKEIDERIDNPEIPEIKTNECSKPSEKNESDKGQERVSDKSIIIPEDEINKLDKIPSNINNESIESVLDNYIEKSNVFENPEITNNNIVKDNEIRGYEKPDKIKPEIVSLKHKRGKINLVQRSKKITIPKPDKTEIEKELNKYSAEKEISINTENILTPEPELSQNTNEKLNLEVTINSTENIESNNSEIIKELENRTTDTIESEKTIFNEELSSNNMDPSKVSSEIAEEIQEISPTLEVQSKKDIDVTQLYHPPKMPRKKHCVKEISNNNVSTINEETKPSVSLSEILSQEEPPPQGDAKVPFRQESKGLSTAETPTSTTGIQNLLSHLAAENVVPPKKDSKSEDNVNMVPPKTESKSDEPAKMPRKKLVKTRPVLRAKRPSQTIKESKSEVVHPRKRALLTENTENSPKETHRLTTSSTSDDDSTLFRGFDNEISTRKHGKVSETDISDDATPDYDETEDDHQTENDLPEKEPMIESTNNVLTIEHQKQVIEEQKEDVKKQEPVSQSITSTSIESINTNLDVSQLEEIPTTKPIDVKKKRGRPSKKSSTKTPDIVSSTVSELADSSVHNNTTEQDASTESGAKKIDKESNNKTSRGKRQSRANSTNVKVSKEVQESSTDSIEVTTGTKRKRQTRGSTPKITAVDQAIPTDSEQQPAKRRCRQRSTASVDVVTPAAVSEVTPDEVVKSLEDIAMITPIPKKRGRQPRSLKHAMNPDMKKIKTEELILNWPEIADFNLRLLLIRKREQLETDEELRENGRGEGALQCGLCLVRCDADNWTLHIGEHYGVGWHKDDYPTFFTRNVILSMMINYLKSGQGQKHLLCRLCNRQLGSGLGMLLHLEGCGARKARIECEFCKQSYTKLSLQQHVRSCPQRFNVNSELDTSKNSVADSDESSKTIFSNAGRAKRKSTIKAETKLQNIAIQMEKHTQDFEPDSSDYDIAADKESSEEYDSDGVDSNEDDAETEDEDVENENGTDDKKGDLTKKKNRSLACSTVEHRKPLYGRLIKLQKVVSKRLKYFVEKSYTKALLYPHLLPRFVKLLPDVASNMLPSRESQSMRYAYGNKTKNAWKQLKPLESFSEKNEYICHLGNPIKELAWVPLPATVSTQYLLCSQRRKVHGYTRCTKDKKEDALLLLLECKLLDNTKNDDWSLQTKLHYGINVPHGPVHSFAFMPSGGYNKAANRLGLLAVGTTSGAVIYSLPLDISKSDADKEKDSKLQADVVIELQVMIALTLDIETPRHDPCTKVTWSQSSGHNLIVTGYASGGVALWNIADKDDLNCIEINNQRHLMPLNFFTFGERNIRCLELHYESSGAHWLAVGSMSRKLVVYNICNWSQPMPIIEDTIHNYFTGDIFWPSLWESLAVGCTDISKTTFIRLMMLNPSGISYSQCTLDLFLSTIRSIHFDHEQLTLVAVTDNGDIVFIKSFEFNMESMMKKRSTNVRSVFYTEANYLGSDSQPKSVSPDTFQEDFGLLLKPAANVPNDKLSTYLNQKRQPSLDLRFLMRLNCVRWNWNTSARNWVAVGAEHGLLRIINFDTNKRF